jgi:hypothetical protein
MLTPTTGTDVPTLRAVTLAKIIWCHPDELDYYAPSACQHSEDHIECFADTICRFGDTLPVVTNGTGGILAGQGRVEAARRVSIEWIPTLWLAHLTEKERKHYIKTLTQIGSLAGWSRDMLQIDLQHLKKIRLSTMAKINGRFFHANGKAQPVRARQ